MLRERRTRFCIAFQVLLWSKVLCLKYDLSKVTREVTFEDHAATTRSAYSLHTNASVDVLAGQRTHIGVSNASNDTLATQELLQVQDPQAIVIMGQLLNEDGSPTPVLQRRVQKAADVFKELGGNAPVICSGGDPHGRGVTEAEVMEGMLRRLGVPANKIMKETSSANTVQNALFVLKMTGQSCKKLHLVTSDFHMPRCAYVYEAVLKSKNREDIELVPQPVSGGCPSAASAGEDDSDGSYQTVNQMTLLERLKLEKKFLANEEYYLKKDSPKGVTIKPLPDERLKQAQDEVDRMIKDEEKRLGNSN